MFASESTKYLHETCCTRGTSSLMHRLSRGVVYGRRDVSRAARTSESKETEVEVKVARRNGSRSGGRVIVDSGGIGSDDDAAAEGRATPKTKRALIDTKPARGTRDFMPTDMRLRDWLFAHFRGVSRVMNFEE